MHPITLNILRAAALTQSAAHFLPPREPQRPDCTTFPDEITNLAHTALAHLLTPSPSHPVTLSQTALFLGTTLGCLETDREFDRSRHPNPRHASPAAFAKTLPSTLPAQLALTFQLTAPSLVLSAGNASAALALRRAAVWMHHLNLPHAIAGGFDFITQNPTTPPTCRVAFLLLANAAALPKIGTSNFRNFSPLGLSAAEDQSLNELLQWIAQPELPANLGAGVTLMI